MKTRYIVTALICFLLILMAVIIARAHTEPIEPPAIHTEAQDVREAPDDVAADAEPEPTACGDLKGKASWKI